MDRAQGGIKLQRGSSLVKGTETGLDDEGDRGAGHVYSPRAIVHVCCHRRGTDRVGARVGRKHVAIDVMSD